MVKFQYISDLHLEHYKNINSIRFEKLDGCDNLFLLGDIGYAYSKIYHSFINYCARKWTNVFVIYGNHEYYDLSKLNGSKTNPKTMEEIEKETEKFPNNVYFLNNNHILINKKTSEVKYLLDREDHSEDYIKIIGSTLWSNINDMAARQMNDYNYIYTSYTTKLTSNETRNFFRQNKDYILQELQLDTFPTILLTHHGIHPLCNGPYMGNFMESGYATEISELYEMPHLIACINGHTHVSIDTIIPNTNIKLLANCYGYRGENNNVVKFNPNVILDIN